MRVSFFITLLLLVFVFHGCAQKTKSVYIPYDKIQKKEKVQKTQKYNKSKKNNMWTQRGIIKGNILSMTYDTNGAAWIYEVKGTSTTNGKLSYAKFLYTKKIGNISDSVYIIIKDKKAKEFYLLEKANIKNASKLTIPKLLKHNKKTLHVKKAQSFEKRTKDRKTPWIGVPKEEVIVLD